MPLSFRSRISRRCITVTMVEMIKNKDGSASTQPKTNNGK